MSRISRQLGELTETLTSNACSPGLFEASSIMMSYFVLGRCSCSKESKAPYTQVNRGTKARMTTTYPFAVDRNLVLRLDAERANFWNIAGTLHVCGIATRAENACNLSCRVYVVGRNECSSRVAREGNDFGWYVLQRGSTLDTASKRSLRTCFSRLFLNISTTS